MADSMTGYGSAALVVEGRSFEAVIRTINSKHFKLKVTAPAYLADHEIAWQKALKNAFLRGMVTLSIKELPTREGCSIDEVAVQSYYQALARLAKELGASCEGLFCYALSALPKQPLGNSSQEVMVQEGLKELVKKTIKACQASRAQEGAALTKQLQSALLLLQKKVDEIAVHLPRRKVALDQRLAKKIALYKGNLDAVAWKQEIVHCLEKIDIEEERVRLAYHLGYFNSTLKKQGAVGKKLLFIAQELLRELNTMGVKAQDAPLQHSIVEMKEIVEQLKEQVQNLL